MVNYVIGMTTRKNLPRLYFLASYRIYQKEEKNKVNPEAEEVESYN